ncbi:type II toxin-antitoxin system death-on-curing family toxin [Parasediminibacterium paludis]|uniref:Type II toxin-antitoxin system death-on-curing family toxin n=1 Tax=Parasediminibacterium paludis TaxID=908966 RepID=A0ABV8PTE9_9BACT
MITLQDVLRFHELSIQKFGGSQGIRDEGYLQSAIERPFSTFIGEELYPTPYEKAAAILESILKNHPFVDGNKRTALIACDAILRLHQLIFTLSQAEAYDFVINVATSQIDFEGAVEFLKSKSVQL